MNKKEQRFCTKLSSHLKKTCPLMSMAIEVKVCDSRFRFSDLRKGQLAALRKLNDGIPLVHKISDGGIGSKLVDLIYLHPRGFNVYPKVAVHFTDKKNSYLFPFAVIQNFIDDGVKSVSPEDFNSAMYRINWIK